jgi:hypothetical protein
LDQSNCGIGAESPLCVARADVFQGQTGNMVKDEKTPFDRRKHIDHCRERRVASQRQMQQLHGRKVYQYPGSIRVIALTSTSCFVRRSRAR